MCIISLVVHTLEHFSLVLVVTDDCLWPYVKRDRERNAAKDDLPGTCMHVTREHMQPVLSPCSGVFRQVVLGYILFFFSHVRLLRGLIYMV
jgi:hypothetical protein